MEVYVLATVVIIVALIFDGVNGFHDAANAYYNWCLEGEDSNYYGCCDELDWCLDGNGRCCSYRT